MGCIVKSVSPAKTAAVATDHSDRDQHWSEMNRLFHVIPQNPHYNQFLKYKQSARDGIKNGLDLGFCSLARKLTTGIKGRPLYFLRYMEYYRSELSEFESFGYDVTKLREIVDAKEIAAKQCETQMNDEYTLDARVKEEKELESRDLEREKQIQNLKNEVISKKSKIEIRKAKFEEDSSNIKNRRAAVAKAAWN